MVGGPGRVGSPRNIIDFGDTKLELLPGTGYVLSSLRATDIDALSGSATLRAGFATMGLAVPTFLAEAAEGLPEGGVSRRRQDTSLSPVAWTRTVRNARQEKRYWEKEEPKGGSKLNAIWSAPLRLDNLARQRQCGRSGRFKRPSR